MKIIFIACLVSGVLFARSSGQEAPSRADSGNSSPEFEFVSLSGEPVSSNRLKGKIIVLDFWSSDCGPCRKSMPQLEEFHRRYRDDQRVAFFFVNSGWETLEEAKAFASSGKSGFLFFSWGKKYDLPFAYDQHSATLKAFGFNSNPSTVIIDSRFRIRVRHSGYIEKFNDFLTEHVEQCLREQ